MTITVIIFENNRGHKCGHIPRKKNWSTDASAAAGRGVGDGRRWPKVAWRKRTFRYFIKREFTK